MKTEIFNQKNEILHSMIAYSMIPFYIGILPSYIFFISDCGEVEVLCTSKYEERTVLANSCSFVSCYLSSDATDR